MHQVGECQFCDMIVGMPSDSPEQLDWTALSSRSRSMRVETPLSPQQLNLTIHTGDTPESSLTHQSRTPSSGKSTDTRALSQERLQCSEESTCKRSTVATMDATLITIKVHVKHDLFPKKKFIIHESELDYSHDKNSIAFQCLEACNVKGPDRAIWWEKWKRTVQMELTTRRNHCQNYCKDAFMSE